MSRCFPFPPPRYEEKDTLAETELLAKEKHTEEKHKKDKKDRDQKERKKEKEGSERTHSDKKDRKEKRKERKHRDKENNRTRGTEDGVRQSEWLTGETSSSNCLQNKETLDSKLVLELGKRIRDNDGARENRVVNCVEQSRTDLPLDNSIENSARDKKSKREDCRSSSGKSTRSEKKSIHKEILQEKENEAMKRKESNGEHAVAVGSCKIVKNGQSVITPDHLEEVLKFPTNRGILGKRKEHDSSLHDQGASSMKLPRPISSSQLLVNGRKSEACQTPDKEAHEKHTTSNHTVEGKVSSYNHIQTTNKHNDGHRKPLYDGVHFGQGKEKIEALPKLNGLQEGQTRFSKPKPPPVNVEARDKCVVSKKLLKVNGMLEAQASMVSSAKFTTSDSEVNKEEKVNGNEKAKLLHACSSKPSVDSGHSNGKGTKSQKRAHRDLKYLNKLLMVPVTTEWSDFDDQEWLFSSGNMTAGKSEGGVLRIDETMNVWAEAFRMESANQIVLPYVLPL